ncbi:hypothetical protein BDBG_04585 [Blastomyces gilchristii SLH14081]|uniref:Zn(2)-C6 fungal-type domain-containing protein n=2 Tax=Blastomyces gilchristii (strain SLH14081) TaxID=559298 RepID=A0A179UPH0_BLAGS|nr:uncharacterized protein BDBG_04585 [Blastomyces gilchristii SLH14081]OAT09007.1 hypothetical protein BDBG_04585 [Blastomyces gilchristii SLH14081]
MGGMMMDLGLGNSSSAQPSQQLQPSSSRQQTRTMDSSQRPRKRARMACTWCHERKVRCDVSIHGSPCTNCRLDGHECTIRSSACRGRGVRTQLQWPEPHSQNGTLVHKSDPVSRMVSRMGPMESILARPTFPQYIDPPRQPPFFGGMWGEQETQFEMLRSMNSHLPRTILPFSLDSPNGDSNVIFSFYRFIELRDLHTLPTEDVKFLEMKGCLHVPSGPILDEFVRQYFLHVHPCLPVLNEADFWSMYANRNDGIKKPRAISLFIVQAMFFASCAFVPPSVIKSAGFVDSRIARNTLYRRAKLLFDLNAENDVLAKAQGAILLTYQSSSIDFHAGSLWLTTAIQHAILYGAHSYNSKSNVTDPHRGTKKRLWWSILLRDRILPLGLRRYPQITPQHFDLSLDCMAEEDLQDEIQKSEVYNAETKRILANVLRVQCQLAIVLTRVIMIVYAPNGFSQPKSMTEKEFMKSLREIEDIRATLTQWANEAKAAFGSIFASDDVHESVTLYSNLTFMYYHTARVALCHNQALTIEIHQRFIAETYSKLLEGLKDELEDAALSITRSVKRLLMRGVARHLPISAIAYTALPLVLNALDVKLSGTTSQSATRKRRLSYYAEVMQLYRNRYDGTDYVALLIQEVLRFVEKQNFLISFQPDESSSIMSSPNSSRDNGKEDTNKSSPVTETSNGPAASNKRTKSWSEVFIRQPRFYLRLSLSIDFAFARGQYPRDTDLPALVRELHLRKDSDQAIETMQPNIPVEVRLKSLPPLTKSQPQPPNQQEQEQEPQQPGDQFTVQDADVYYGVDGMTEVPNPEQQQEQQPQQSHQILVSHPPPADHNLAPQLTTDQLLFNNSTPSPVNLREVNLDFLDLESPLLDSLNGGVELGVRADDSGEDGDFTFGKVGSSYWVDGILEEIITRVHT